MAIIEIDLGCEETEDCDPGMLPGLIADQIIAAMKVGEISGVPVLRSEASNKKYEKYHDVRISWKVRGASTFDAETNAWVRSPQETRSVTFRLESLAVYLIGFQSKDGRWWEFNPEKVQVDAGKKGKKKKMVDGKTQIPESTRLPFGGNYNDIGGDRSKLIMCKANAINYLNLLYHYEGLAHHEIPCREALLFVIQLLCENTRFLKALEKTQNQWFLPPKLKKTQLKHGQEEKTSLKGKEKEKLKHGEEEKTTGKGKEKEKLKHGEEEKTTGKGKLKLKHGQPVPSEEEKKTEDEVEANTSKEDSISSGDTFDYLVGEEGDGINWLKLIYLQGLDDWQQRENLGGEEETENGRRLWERVQNMGWVAENKYKGKYAKKVGTKLRDAQNDWKVSSLKLHKTEKCKDPAEEKKRTQELKDAKSELGLAIHCTV